MNPSETYGSLKEGIHVAGYTLERAWGNLERLLEENRWREIGNFSDVNAFLDSIQLDSFRIVAEHRKRIALRIKELQPEAAIRAIGRTLGADHKTIGADIGEDSPKKKKKQQ